MRSSNIFDNYGIIIHKECKKEKKEPLPTPAGILYKSIVGRYRPVSYPDRPITARYRFIKNASWDPTYFFLKCYPKTHFFYLSLFLILVPLVGYVL